jgi:hypothetical protein
VRGRRRFRIVAVGFIGAAILSACGIDWPTWGNSVERQGFNGSESTIGTNNVANLRHLWSVDLGAYINASPILAQGINVSGTATDLIYVGTEHGDLFALRTNGTTVWHRNLGARVIDCPDTPDKVYGVSAPVAFDRNNNRVYVAGGDGFFYALNASTGATVSGWPVGLTFDPGRESVFSAPTLFGNTVYVAFASHCDTTPYKGRLVSIDINTRATNVFWVTGINGPSGGGIWGWGGASVDPANGDVYVATGNSFGASEHVGFAEHVVRLSSSLQVKASHWPGTLIGDDDFGSTPTLYQKSGCPPQLVTEQKNGNIYQYNRDSIGSGGRVVAKFGSWLIGVPAYSPATQTVYVVNPRSVNFFAAGLVAFSIDGNCNLQYKWQRPANVGVGSTPTVANGVVYYSGGFAGTIHAVSEATGQELWASKSTDLPRPVLATPVVVNGFLYAGSYDNRLHAWGL